MLDTLQTQVAKESVTRMQYNVELLYAAALDELNQARGGTLQPGRPRTIFCTTRTGCELSNARYIYIYIYSAPEKNPRLTCY